MATHFTSKELVGIFAGIVGTCTLAACGSGTSQGFDDAGSSGACGTAAPPRERETVAFIPRNDCLDASTADAGDASADAGDASADADATADDSGVACNSDYDPNLCQRHCRQFPGGGMVECALSSDKKTVTCTRSYLCGRRFEGLAELEVGLQPSTSLGTFAAESAYLEAASVHAFRWMADEIAAHDLGVNLAAWARRAAREEARHARMMTSLARSFGVDRPPRVKRPARRARSLEEIALENVIEGCVRETYGALLATYQAAHADDPRLRAVFSHIAKDETSHAALAWSLAAAIDARLEAGARKRVQGARVRAFSRLGEMLERHAARGDNPRSGLSNADRVRLGHPSANVECRLLRSLRSALAA